MSKTANDRQSTLSETRKAASGPAFREGLAELIAYPSDASKAANAGALSGYLDHVGALLGSIGFEILRTEAEGRPFLIARRIEDPGLPTDAELLPRRHRAGDGGPLARGIAIPGRSPKPRTKAACTGAGSPTTRGSSGSTLGACEPCWRRAGAGVQRGLAHRDG
jgi:hypothetical protein